MDSADFTDKRGSGEPVCLSGGVGGIDAVKCQPDKVDGDIERRISQPMPYLSQAFAALPPQEGSMSWQMHCDVILAI